MILESATGWGPASRRAGSTAEDSPGRAPTRTGGGMRLRRSPCAATRPGPAREPVQSMRRLRPGDTGRLHARACPDFESRHGRQGETGVGMMAFQGTCMHDQRRTTRSMPPRRLLSPIRTFATKKLSTGANGDKEGASQLLALVREVIELDTVGRQFEPYRWRQPEPNA